MSQVAFPLENEMGDDLRLRAPFICPLDHFVKDPCMELLEKNLEAGRCQRGHRE